MNGMEAEVAGREIELLIVGRVVRDMHLSVFPCYRAVFLKDHGRVVIKTGCTMLKKRSDDDHAQFLGQQSVNLC